MIGAQVFIDGGGKAEPVTGWRRVRMRLTFARRKIVRLRERVRLAPAMRHYGATGDVDRLLAHATDPDLDREAMFVLHRWAEERIPTDYPAPFQILRGLQEGGHHAGIAIMRHLREKVAELEQELGRLDATPEGVPSDPDLPAEASDDPWHALYRRHPDVAVHVLAIHIAHRDRDRRRPDALRSAFPETFLRRVARQPEAAADPPVRDYFARSRSFAHYRTMATHAAPALFPGLVADLMAGVAAADGPRGAEDLAELLEAADSERLATLGDDVWRALLGWGDARVRQAAVQQIGHRTPPEPTLRT